jgi:hypothetical protein
MKPEVKEEFKLHLAELFSYLKDELKLKTAPKIVLSEDSKNSAKILGKTAYYSPEEKKVVLFVTDRHPKDILRSFAHEVIHHWQHQHDKFSQSTNENKDPQYAQHDPWLRQMEKQAYLLGNILFRDWEDNKKNTDRKSEKGGRTPVEENDQQSNSIPDDAPYGVKDTQTKQWVYKTTYKNRTRARKFADRKDLEYGAVRYVPMRIK